MQSKQGRPKDKEKEEDILYAAAKLFLQKGLQKTSMEAIAKTAGVSKQTVYSHFQNKSLLFKAVITFKVNSYFQYIENIEQSKDLQQGLYIIAKQFLGLLLDPETIAMQRLIISEAMEYPEMGQIFYDSGPLQVCTMVGNFLQQQVEQKNLIIEDIQFAGHMYLSMLKGLFHIQALINIYQEDGVELDRQINNCIKVFLQLYARDKSLKNI